MKLQVCHSFLSILSALEVLFQISAAIETMELDAKMGMKRFSCPSDSFCLWFGEVDEDGTLLK